MGVQNPFEVRSGNNSVVDALIGNAYEVVKYVAYYVKEIQYVALNMADVHRVSQNLYEHVLLEDDILSLGSEIEFELPNGVTAAMLLNINCIVITSAGSVYGVGADTISWLLEDGVITVSVSGDAPDSFVGAKLRCLINWQSPVTVG